VLADGDGSGRLDFEEFKAVFKRELNISEAKVRSSTTLNVFRGSEAGYLGLFSMFH